MAARDPSFDSILEVKPTLHELCEHVRLGTKWRLFGVLLKLDVKSLGAIEVMNNDIENKAMTMFQLWLDTNKNATRREVIKTLKKDTIGEVNVAENYEKVLREEYDDTNLSTLLSQYSLSHDKLEKECDDGLFIEISRHVDDYTKVGYGLNLSKDMLESISQSKESDVERKIAVLWAWKRKNGSAATAKKLVNAFLRIENRLVAESILNYLSKKTTSNEHQVQCLLAPEKVKHQYPKWEELTESEKEGVRNKLEEDNRDVREAYAVFAVQLAESMGSRGVDPSLIQVLVHSYNPSEGIQKLPTVFNFVENSIGGVFSELSKHCTWFNYELFQVIVKYRGNEAEKQYLKTYEDDHLVPYLRRSIYEIPCAQSQNQSRTNLLFKMPTNICLTGNEVKVVQRKLARLLGFESSTLLHFENYNDGCIELVFSLPTVILEKPPPKCQPFMYIEWEESRGCYKVNVAKVTELSQEVLEVDDKVQFPGNEKVKLRDKEVPQLSDPHCNNEKKPTLRSQNMEIDLEIDSVGSKLIEDLKGGEIATTLTAKFEGTNDDEDNLEYFPKDSLTHLESSSDNEDNVSIEGVKWLNDRVELISPTVEECIEVMSKLKSQELAGKYTKIILKSSSPSSALIIFNNINECLVRELDIENTCFDIQCIHELSNVLSYNKTMEELWVHSSPFPPNSIRTITNALSINTMLKTLRLIGDDSITDKEVPCFCKMLAINTTLKGMHLSFCDNITEFGEQQLLKVLDHNNTLVTLCVNGKYLRE